MKFIQRLSYVRRSLMLAFPLLALSLGERSMLRRVRRELPLGVRGSFAQSIQLFLEFRSLRLGTVG